MSGAYIGPAYRLKFFGGQPASVALVSKIFLSGFVATAALGPALAPSLAYRHILRGWVWLSAPLGRWGRLATLLGALLRLGAARDASRQLGLDRGGPRLTY